MKQNIFIQQNIASTIYKNQKPNNKIGKILKNVNGIHLKYNQKRIAVSACGYITAQTKRKKYRRVLVFIVFNLAGERVKIRIKI